LKTDKTDHFLLKKTDQKQTTFSENFQKNRPTISINPATYPNDEIRNKRNKRKNVEVGPLQIRNSKE
jgi:hypothetical protein